MKNLTMTIWMVLAGMMLASCASDRGPVRPSRPTMAGTVTFREPIALPSTATLTVRLLDVTRAGEPAIVLAERSISNPGNPPLSFELPYPFGGITANRSYVIEARIEVWGRLRFFAPSPHVVTPGNAARVHVIELEQSKQD